MPKMTITGTEEQLKAVKDALYDLCPFNGQDMEGCGEDADCFGCIDDNIEWIIVED